MDRETLSYFLNSGSSRVFNPRKIAGADKQKRVFHINALNQCFFFKYPIAADDTNSEYQQPIVTLAYYPYDRSHPAGGGESFIYTPDSLTYYLNKFANSADVTSSGVLHDNEVLDVLDSVPTFSPFLLKEAFERSSLNLTGLQFEITDRESAKIKQSLRNRLRPLVGFAFGDQGNRGANRQAIETLTERLWELDDMKALTPLIEAFRMPPDQAKELFYGWTGITFFEQEYIRLQPSLRDLAQWFVVASKPKENLPRAVLEPYTTKLTSVKTLVRVHWRASLEIINEYSSTYEAMLSSTGNAAGFVKFLNNSSAHFWALGAHLSRLDHAAEILGKIGGRGSSPPYNFDYCERVLSVLHQTLGATPPSDLETSFRAAS